MKKLFIILISTLTLALSCQKNEVSTPSNSRVPITVSASIENIGLETKSPYTLTVPTDKEYLTAAIWASTTPKNYQGTQSVEPDPEVTNVVDYHNSTCFTSGTKQLLDHQLFYPKNEAPVYFVGFCPRSQDGWTVFKEEGQDNYNVARYHFDGKTDVMFAPESSNSIKTSSRDLKLKFRHMLTWIRFCVVADKDAIDAWGDLKKITIRCKEDIKINVSTETASFESDNNAFPTYITSKSGEFKDNEFNDQAVALTTSAQEVAYTLCSAVLAAAGDGVKEYTVDIETERRPSTTVEINLKAADGSDFVGLTEGRQFTVILRFKLGDNVTVAATVSEWKNAGIGVADIEEK